MTFTVVVALCAMFGTEGPAGVPMPCYNILTPHNKRVMVWGTKEINAVLCLENTSDEFGTWKFANSDEPKDVLVLVSPNIRLCMPETIS